MNKVPMLDLKREYDYMKTDVDAAISRCLEHQQWILGPEVKELEQKAADYLSAKYCVGVSSGTDALVLSLRALALKLKGQEYFSREDKIITTPFTFTATGDAILRAGATPVFVDIDPLTFNIDPNKISDYLKTNPHSAVGIIPVHLYGKPCEMDTIMSLAKDHHLFVVEDVAQAFGGDYKGKKLGTIGDLGTFSFFPSKNLGGFGDGGLVATETSDLVELVRILLKHGGKDKYNVEHIGYNARLDTLQAAVIIAKLKYLDEFNKRRQHIARIYSQELKNIAGLTTPKDEPGHVYHQYTLRVLNGKRDALQKHLKDHDVDSMVYYPVPLHQMKVFSGRCRINHELVEAEKASKEVLSLPIEPLLNDEEILSVRDLVSKAI